jgi:hypothetical protein
MSVELLSRPLPKVSSPSTAQAIFLAGRGDGAAFERGR